MATNPEFSQFQVISGPRDDTAGIWVLSVLVHGEIYDVNRFPHTTRNGREIIWDIIDPQHTQGGLKVLLKGHLR